jgi:phage/conjugal plasmid C-4 type zinc finger TraR family protein
MTALTTSERDSLARMLGERKALLREEIRRGLARMGNERYVDLLSGTSDAGDESVAMLLTDVANAEVARDAAELRDIVAAEARIAAGTYGTCIDCGAPIPFARLAAYPTAKRCLRCQQIRETTHAPAGRG